MTLLTVMTHYFGPCELDQDRRILRRNGRPIHVEPQVFDFLLVLVKADGAVVSKDTLIEKVWLGLNVSDATIGSRVSAARRAVGDDGKAQSIIKTVPKVGFQMACAVRESQSQNHIVPRLCRGTIKFVASSDDEAIAYACHGSGAPLVRVSHWLSHLEMDMDSPVWRPFLDRLAQEFTLLRYDQRSTGLSTRSVANLDIDMFVEDLKAVVDATGLRTFPIFAASQAVPVALRFARLHPDRVSRIVLYGGYAEGRCYRDIVPGDVEEETVISLIRAGWGNEKSAFFRAFSSLFMPGGTPEQIQSFVEMQSRSICPENAVQLRRAVDRFNVLDDLAYIQHPVLVIHARDDGVHPLSQGQLLAANLPNAEFIMLDSANHIPLPQDPAWSQLTEVLISFCKQR